MQEFDAERHPIYALAERMVDDLAAASPDEATLRGIPGHDHRWTNHSPDGRAEIRDLVAGFRRQLDTLPAAGDRWADLAISVASAYVDEQIDRHDRGAWRHNLNSIDSPLQAFRETFDNAPRGDDGDWANIAARLETLPVAMHWYRTGLDAGRREHDMAAVRQVREVIRQCRAASSPRSPLEALPAEYGEGPLRARLDDAATTGKRAFDEFADYLDKDYLPAAPEGDGVGGERYVAEARRFLGTDIDPAETYRWGWSQVAELRRRMLTVAAEIAEGGVEDALHVLKTDPARAAPDREAFVDFVQQRLDQALVALDGTHFDVPTAIQSVEVRIAPPGGALGAYYVSPSEDLSRPGTVWWSLTDTEAPLPLYDEVSTAYHEGFPGHHLQSGIQVTLADRLSRLQRVWVWKSGSGEGWALYAERLMDELGFLERPDYVFGYLALQILRACRVVIDIGSHLQLQIPSDQPFHPGEPWTFATAVEMLERYATLDHAVAVSEVTRYLGWPGQAISYKLGERAILDLREDAAATASFDAKSFHGRVLGAGAVGLDVLRDFLGSSTGT